MKFLSNSEFKIHSKGDFHFDKSNLVELECGKELKKIRSRILVTSEIKLVAIMP